MSGPNVKVTGVAILVGKVELYEPVPMDANVDAFYVDMGAKSGVGARNKGRTVGVHADVRTRVDTTKFGRRRGH
jgi:hypothetical protein